MLHHNTPKRVYRSPRASKNSHNLKAERQKVKEQCMQKNAKDNSDKNQDELFFKIADCMMLF